MRSLTSEMARNSAADIVSAREKCSRNKRKFRQDPPFPSSQGNSDETSTGSTGLSNAGVTSDGESNWMPESTTARSVEVVSSTKSGCLATDAPSCKGSDSAGTIISDSKSNAATNNNVSEMTTSSRSVQQDQVKLMRFRSGQATRPGRLVVSGTAGGEGKQLLEESSAGVEGHSSNSGDKAFEEPCNEFYEAEEEEWDDAESELEDLILKNLGSIYDEAIDKIVASGRSTEEAFGAVLTHGRCYGGKDPVSNIVENSLAYLSGNRQPTTDGFGSSSPGDPSNFSDLSELLKYSLAQMVGLLREVRPSLSKGDAMWCLLVSDMNVPMACVMDESALPPPVNKELQQQFAPPPPPTNNPSSAGLAGSGVDVGASSLPSTTSPPPPNCDSKSIPSNSSTPLNSFDSPPHSMHPPSTAISNSHLPSVVSLMSISTSSVAPKSPPSPPKNPSTSTPDVSLLSLSDSVPHSFACGGLESDEVSLNGEGLSASEGGTGKKLTNNAEAEGADCASNEVDDDDIVDEQAHDENVGGLTSSAVTPAVASLKLDDQEEQASTTGFDGKEKLAEHSATQFQEPVREPASQGLVGEVVNEIKKLRDNAESFESKQRTTSQLEASVVAEINLATTDCVVSTAESQSGMSSISPLQPANPDVTSKNPSGILASEEDTSSISLRLPETTSSVAETPKEATSSPPAVKFGTVDEPEAAGAGTAAAESVSSSDLPAAERDGEETSTSTSADGTAISCETSQAFSQVAQQTALASEDHVARETATSTSASSPGVAPADCLGSSNETTASVSGKGQAEDQKDDKILKLVHRSKELETQLQERTEWAKQKVMQAARKLSNDLQELKELRRERDEALRLKKDKQALEDSTTKKITDLESALRKAKSQYDEANKNRNKVVAENAEIRAEMQAAKLSAAEALSSCQEMASREKKSVKRAQRWERQKAELQEELSEEKRKVVALQQQLLLAKERQQQAEVRWRQEEKAREEAVLRADHERRSREQAETAAKKREDSLRRKAESNYQRHREDIQRLESEISQFRTSAEAAQLATSRWGPGVAVTPHMMELSSLQGLKESNNRLAREIAELQDMARRDVHRERECVMCMCEEMSVVFLPCAHQVVCVKCNDLHEKQGMRECPSCRTPIKQRIRVYGVST